MATIQKIFLAQDSTLGIIRLKELHLYSQDAFATFDYSQVKFILNKKESISVTYFRGCMWFMDRTGSEFIETLLHSRPFSVRERRAGAVSDMCVDRALCLSYGLQIGGLFLLQGTEKTEAERLRDSVPVSGSTHLGTRNKTPHQSC